MFSRGGDGNGTHPFFNVFKKLAFWLSWEFLTLCWWMLELRVFGMLYSEAKPILHCALRLMLYFDQLL